MANICSYFIEAKGPQSDLNSIQAFIQKGIRETKACDGDPILDYERLFPEDVKGYDDGGYRIMEPDLGHTSIWFDDQGRHAANFEDDTLVMSGDSKWSPPLQLVERLSQMYPSVVFEAGGTTEHEYFEHHRYVNGAHSWLESCVINPKEDTETWLIKDGRRMEDAIECLSDRQLTYYGLTRVTTK